MKDEPLRVCPVCSEPQAKRQISAGTGFILKGGGWYSDLYASSGTSKSNGNGTSDTKSDKADKSDSTSTSKEATKKEPSKGTSAGT